YTSDGTQAIAVHNADFSLVTASRPLLPGEFAFVYAAGLGDVSNRPATGAAASASPLSEIAGVAVTLAGIPCEVAFAGLAPGFAGLYQVDFRVPANAPSGLQDLIVTSAGIASPPSKVIVR